jgi:nucleoside-diphosphate-sugar epimerase
MARVLILGARGFVGSAVARALAAEGHQISGLARSDEAAEALRQARIAPVAGDMDRLEQVAAQVGAHDATVFAPTVPFADEWRIAEALIEPLIGSDRPFIFTSGTAVLSHEAHDGHWNEATYAEDDPFSPPEWIAMRVETENRVRAMAERGVRAMVVRPPLIWGHGGSKQIPAIFDSIATTGAACYLGAGLNLYSNVHVDDLASVYRLAIERGTAGALYHAVAGEANFRALAEAAAVAMDCGTRSIDIDEARKVWGDFVGPLFFGVNSRSRAVRTRAELGWVPQHLDVVEDVRRGSYRARYRQD